MRPRKLTPRQVAELRQRYRIYLANSPKKLASEYGVNRSTIMHYLWGMHSPRNGRI